MWEDASTNHATIKIRVGGTLIMRVVYGHVAYPQTWILQTEPKIFHSFQTLTGGPADVEDVQKAAETICRRRLTLMLNDVNQ